jgi:hypothetical protein
MRAMGRRQLLVALLAAIAAAAALTSGASASDDPVWGDSVALPATVPALANLVASSDYHLRIRAVLLANDDGTNVATVTGNQIDAAVEGTNAIWAGSGFVFDFDPAFDVEVRKSTLLNNDCTVFYRYMQQLPQAYCDPEPNVEERERVALDPFHDGRITLYFRYGNANLTCSNFLPLTCTNKAATGGFSSMAGHYVVLTGYGASATSLAHELGHYLWNAHTHGPMPDTLAAAQQQIQSYVDGPPSHTVADGLAVFDGDKDRVTDTPPDPGPDLWKALKGDPCANGRGDGSAWITVDLASGPATYRLAPDRTNVMSYFKGCSTFPHTTSPQQQARALDAVVNENRAQLICGICPPHFARLDHVWTTAYPMGATAIVPFTLNRRPHLLVYMASGWKLNIERIGDKATELTNLSSGWFMGAWTSFVPYTLNGSQYFLAYKASNGDAQIIRVRPSGSGFDVLWSGTRPSGYTVMTPFVQDGQAYMLAYDGGSGHAAIDRFDAAGNGSTTVWSGVLPTGYGAAVPYIAAGKPYALLYNANGVVTTVRLKSGGVDVVAFGWLGPGFTSFAAFDRGPQPRFVAYNGSSGVGKVYRIETDGTGFAAIADWDPFAPKFSSLVPFRLLGQWYLFGYGASMATTTLVLH